MATPLDWALNFMGNSAGALSEPSVGINPGLHPRGSRTRSEVDPLEMILGNKNQVLQNLRSPMVRRSAGGRVVDENEPEGLDWLEQNGPGRSGQPVHSWEQDTSGWVPPPQSQGGYNPFEPAPAQMTKSASGVRAMQGPYGGGFSTGVDEPLIGEFEAPSPYREAAGAPYDPFNPTEEPMMQDEQAANSANIMNAYNETLTNPRQSPAAGQVARSRALDRTTQGVRSGAMPVGAGLGFANPADAGPVDPAAQQGSVTMPTQSEGKNAYTPFDGGPALPGQSSLPDDVGYFDKSNELLDTAGVQAVVGDRPGILPMAGRAIGAAGATGWDAIANLLWRSGASTTETTDAYLNWLMQNRQNEPRYQPNVVKPEPVGSVTGGILPNNF